jgi:predicted permease
MVLVNNVGPHYFSTMKIALLAGREFTAADTEKSPPVAIVNEAFARRFWPGQSALGRQLRAAGARPRELGPPVEVVGVVRDSKYYSLGEEPQPILYQSLGQAYSPELVLLIATTVPAPALINSVRQKLLNIDSALAADVRAMEENVETAFLPSRIAVLLTGTFGFVGLLLASAGVYGLIAYTAGQRRKEIGIRMAIGAEQSSIVRMVVRKAIVLSAYGLAAGTVFSAALAQVVKTFLIGVGAADPLTYSLSGIVVLGVAMAASLVPAVRAAKINPIETLRSE